MNTNDKQRLSLIFKFVETFQNQIRLFDFDVNRVSQLLINLNYKR